MSRKNRDRDPDVYHHIYTRTMDGVLSFADYKAARQIIGGIIARYQAIFNIEIFAYVVLGNHIHLLVKSQVLCLDEFMENVCREISKRIGRHNGTTGRLWVDRYKDEVIEDDDGALRCMLYILTNPVKHGLTRDSYSWKGLHSLEQLGADTPPEFEFTLRRKILRYELKLSRLPQFAELSKGEYCNLLSRYIGELEQTLVKEHPERKTRKDFQVVSIKKGKLNCARHLASSQ